AAGYPDGVTATLAADCDDADALTGTVTFTAGVTGVVPWTGFGYPTLVAGTFAGEVTGRDTLTITGSLDAEAE
ncbi:MAG: hypothetical protein ACK4N5_25045, partial [Myxococcales bacterium]